MGGEGEEEGRDGEERQRQGDREGARNKNLYSVKRKGVKQVCEREMGGAGYREELLAKPRPKSVS